MGTKEKMKVRLCPECLTPDITKVRVEGVRRYKCNAEKCKSTGYWSNTLKTNSHGKEIIKLSQFLSEFRDNLDSEQKKIIDKLVERLTHDWNPEDSDSPIRSGEYRATKMREFVDGIISGKLFEELRKEQEAAVAEAVS
jgi:hypothetical protein